MTAGCGWADQCFGLHARTRVHTVDIVVCNFHLLLAELRIRAALGIPVLLPETPYLICDEAHELPDIAREFFGAKVSWGRVHRWGRRWTKEGAVTLRQAGDAREAVDRCMKRLAKTYASKDYFARLRTEADAAPLAHLANELRGVRDSIGHDDAAEKLTVIIQDCRALAESVDLPVRDATHAVFLEEIGTPGKSRKLPQVRAVSHLINPGNALQDHLFSQFASCIFTSATLCTGTGARGFDHYKNELGLRDCETLTVPSPFDVYDQSYLVVPTRLHTPTGKSRERWEADLPGHVEDAIYNFEGRTLALFTSYKMLDLVHRHLQDCAWIHEEGIRLLRQGDAPRLQLISQFRDDVSSVLLGTTSFWTGVDVPGESLTCVVIDKLPFARPDNPVLSAIKDAGGSTWFTGYSLPRAAIMLRQGAGRLIRSRDDAGAVVILDNRLRFKGYGRALLRSLGMEVRNEL